MVFRLIPEIEPWPANFGVAVAIDGVTAVVGKNTDEDEPAGSAYVYNIDSCFLILGDVNGDGSVNLLDVQPFVELLTSGGYQAEADINQDGVVNLLDVGPFVELLSGG